jgi:hypothetical protein
VNALITVEMVLLSVLALNVGLIFAASPRSGASRAVRAAAMFAAFMYAFLFAFDAHKPAAGDWGPLMPSTILRYAFQTTPWVLSLYLLHRLECVDDETPHIRPLWKKNP